jgi:hypothetical protein
MMFILEPLDGVVLLSAVDNGVQLLVTDRETGLITRVIEIDGHDLVIGRDEVVE